MTWPQRSVASVDRLTIDGMRVDRFGERGRPVILIPGLSGGQWVWKGFTETLARDHVVYVITLPGFAQVPPQGSNSVQAASARLLKLINQEGLVGPILVGHSLGGTIALDFASRYPSKIAGVISVDGLPVFPGTEQVPAPERRALAEQVMSSLPRDRAEFWKEQLAYMKSANGVIDPALAAELAKMSALSDPAVVASYVGDGLMLDLRSRLPLILVPVLLIVPYNEADVRGSAFAFTEEQKVAYYQTLMEGTPYITVGVISPARHFAMFDQPQKTLQSITTFIARIAKL